MYSPKINEELIPMLYRIAKARGMPMTEVVNEIIERALKEIGNTDKEVTNDKIRKGDKK